jgi:hypothetical protein
VINNLDAPPSLLRNEGGADHSLIVKCTGTRSNRSAIGARVKVTVAGRDQIDEVMSGSSYYSQNDLRLHFGLGKADQADRVEVSWPSGATDSVENVKANRIVWIEEGRGAVKSEPFRARGK